MNDDYDQWLDEQNRKMDEISIVVGIITIMIVTIVALIIASVIYRVL